jgi:hypothetical protein
MQRAVAKVATPLRIGNLNIFPPGVAEAEWEVIIIDPV